MLYLTGLLCLTEPVAQPADSPVKLDVPPRLQWNANYGYCGETSFISAGLYYGQYCSQFTARALASPGVAQSKANSQLLLGVNDVAAAKAMHLAVTAWKPAQESKAEDFLKWTVAQVAAGHPVAIGVFTNEYLFYGNTSPSAGDADYDHIVPVVGLSQAAYRGTGTLTFSDNGLWSPTGTPPYLFSYKLGEFPRTRKEANAKTGPVYSLKSDGTNYGMAFSGVMDLNKDTVPVRVTTSVNNETPAMKNRSNTAPAPSRLTLTVTVTLPNQNVEYNLYRYNDFARVPDQRFNANAAKAATKWRIPKRSGTTYVLKVSILSNETAVFRAVALGAP